MRRYQAVLLGRDQFFRAEVQFEVDEATPGDIEDNADEAADAFAEILMRELILGRVDVDSVTELA